jgi:hypothetical protein
VVVVEGSARALVRRGEKPNHVEVIAFGPAKERLRLLEIIQGNLERINADVPGPRPYAELEIAGLPGVYRSIADLEAAERAEQAVVISGPPEAKVEPTPQLNNTSERENRDLSKVPLDAFLSYSHEDKRAKNVFQNNLTVMMKKRFITPWHDGLIEPGMRWQEEIAENLEKMDVFVGLLTTAFLASDFIEKVEIKAARKKLRERGREFLFVLILVDDISLKGLDLAEYQLLKPGGKPVCKHASQKAGFDAAQKELEELLARRQAAKKKEEPEFRMGRTPMREEVVQEGVTIIVKGDYVVGGKSMRDDRSIHIGGNVSGQVGQALTNCTNIIQEIGQDRAELRAALEELQKRAAPVLKELPPAKAEEAAANLEDFTKEAAKEKPRKPFLAVTGAGLVDAAKTVAKMSGPIIEVVDKLKGLLGF